MHMTKPVIAVDETTPVSRIADLMLLHRIRRVPVTRDGRLLGLISRRDVLRVTMQSLETPCGLPRVDTQLGACQ
jgi:signal-transduction protein with cAMP-binding, CBS, and nucleotidyltransferase domain